MQRWVLAFALGGALTASLSACATAAARKEHLPVFEAVVSHSVTAKEDESRDFPGLIGHGVRQTLWVSIPPDADRREILLDMGIPTGCVGEARAFWSEYERLSATVPPLRVRLHGAEDRLIETNGTEVDRARRRTAPEAERLLTLCDLDDDEDRAAARARFEKARDRRSNVNEKQAFELHALFIAVGATDGFTKWDAPDEEGPCPEVAGPVLTKLRFKSSVRCTRSVIAADPEDPLVEGHIGTVHITGYDAGPDPSTVSASVQISRTDEVRAAPGREAP